MTPQRLQTTKRLVKSTCVAGLCLLAAACGQTGELRLPDKPSPSPSPSPEPLRTNSPEPSEINSEEPDSAKK